MKMTNRQWLMWQIIDMSDEELLTNFTGFMCDIYDKYITPHKADEGECPIVLAWLKKEHEEGRQ